MYQHIYQPSVIFSRMRAAGLKTNDTSFSLGFNNIPCLGYIITREGIKPYPNKVQGIINIGKPTTMTEARSLIVMLQYCIDMWSRQSHVISPLLYLAISPKVRTIIWNNNLELNFQYLKKMISSETLLHFPDWKIPFTVHPDASDQQLGAVISQNNKPIDFFLII